ncbi:DUF2507 domain-containing protein [Oceanobacillus sp. Castelsardo]|uniref:DUF2507 domain-containing protein n=1 Tax=Oceanobacillus sp. Castelsardo TaxID=1851204 RepID=UPI0008393A0A|nr:DUF2507 domain-containing protein [Oceanobacillus sp. Castelsardo]
MSKKADKLTISQLEKLHTNGAGYDALRYIGLPEVLGKEANSLLYFIGKNLARKIEIDSLETLILIFETFGWGKLELIKEKKNELIFHLMDDSVVLKLNAPFHADFRLESGFLAEAIQQIEGRECECIEEINKRIYTIKFAIFFTDK